MVAISKDACEEPEKSILWDGNGQVAQNKSSEGLFSTIFSFFKTAAWSERFGTANRSDSLNLINLTSKHGHKTSFTKPQGFDPVR